MPAITAIGAAHIDRIVRLDAPTVPGASNPGRTTSRAGGVIRNAAETAARLGVGVRLVTRVGADAEAARVRDSLSGLPVTFAPLAVRSDIPTASYTAVLDPRGDLVMGLADMAAYETITPAEVLAALDEEPGHLLIDANLPEAAILALIAATRRPVVAIGVSVAKVVRLRPVLDRLALLIVNQREAETLGRLAPTSIVTRGAAGASLIDASGETRYGAPAARVVDVNGAGDSLAGGVVAGLARGLEVADALNVGLAVAARAVGVDAAVDPTLNWDEVAP